ncbi:hypothetical protein JTE90_011283 [Oedothorax gibbosus]|uniref:RING-type E3 ubiquitin transferase n=1 Tax=Oedothorax gibbosus TaxID=931172 RepID=A0AAV6VM28_9ARAC|nr:hypothetical protein JTE90_011283 [Oedothorax gibbosus]
MPVQAPQWTDFLTCLICCNEFECNIRRPISLGCGHTMCKSCLSKLQRKQCPFDQTVINIDINQLPENYALLQLVGGAIPEALPNNILSLSKDDYSYYLEAKKCVEELALYLKLPSSGATNGVLQNSPLSRPMQRKLVTLINCQLVEEEGRSRAMRAARSLGERSVTELILQHQNPQQLSANLWAAVRARGCQFLGPAMQEEVLKLVLLALEDSSALSRKVLVMFVVQRLVPHFPQASKTSIGHVVQLLYRASCFKVSKRDGDSSLMQLKEEFHTYQALRREHDAQIVQIAIEAGLRIAPEQWSSLLYGDTAHKSHMQSIIDKLQTPQSFSQSVQELVIALQRTEDPGNLSILRPHLELLAAIDPSPDAPTPVWKTLKQVQEAVKCVVKGLFDFLQNFGNRKLQEERLNWNAKYKTSMCRDLTKRRTCPRGLNCTFAHSQDELEMFRTKSKRTAGGWPSGTSAKVSDSDVPPTGAKEDVLSHKFSPTISIMKSHSSSSAVHNSPECGLSRCVFNSDDSSDPEATLAESSTAHLYSAQYNNLCSMSSSSDMHPSLPPHLLLNPESPPFQPISSPQSFQATSKLGSDVPTKLSAIPSGSTCVPTVKLKQTNSSSISPPSVSSSVINCDTSFASPTSSLQPLGHGLVQCNTPISSVPFSNQISKSQSVTTVQEGQGYILAVLEGNTTKYHVLNPMDDVVDMVYPYSYWSSVGASPHGQSSHLTSSSHSEGKSSSNKEEVDDDLSDIDLPNCAFALPSEKDEFIPFDRPLVSKYGPISRCSKSLIRGTAPIQVNAVFKMGELTSPTSSVQHPLSSASLAPTFSPTHSPKLTVPVVFISEQHLPLEESDSFIVPVALCLPNEPQKRGNTSAVTKRFIPNEDFQNEALCELKAAQLIQAHLKSLKSFATCQRKTSKRLVRIIFDLSQDCGLLKDKGKNKCFLTSLQYNDYIEGCFEENIYL